MKNKDYNVFYKFNPPKVLQDLIVLGIEITATLDKKGNIHILVDKRNEIEQRD